MLFRNTNSIHQVLLYALGHYLTAEESSGKGDLDVAKDLLQAFLASAGP